MFIRNVVAMLGSMKVWMSMNSSMKDLEEATYIS